MREPISQVNLAKKLKCSTRTIRRWVREGRIPPPHKNGQIVRFDYMKVCAWIEKWPTPDKSRRSPRKQ